MFASVTAKNFVPINRGIALIQRHIRLSSHAIIHPILGTDVQRRAIRDIQLRYPVDGLRCASGCGGGVGVAGADGLARVFHPG